MHATFSVLRVAFMQIATATLILAIVAFGPSLLSGCGGGGDSGSDSDKPTPKLQSGQAITVYMVNSAGAPADQFTREVGYADQQFSRDVSPRWGVEAHVAQSSSVLSDQPCVELVGGPGGGPNGANSWLPLPGIHGYSCYNTVTIADGSWPARLDHVALNLLDTTLLIGQQYEAMDYNPLDFSQTQLDGLYWLCDFALPSGADFLSTKGGK